MSKIIKPINPLIFKVAGSIAAEWYEIGRSQGLKSKWPNARLYAKHNIEKFIPKAIDHLLDILFNPSFPELAKEEIYEALLDPVNDKDLMDGSSQMDDINAKKLDEIVKEYEKRKLGSVTSLHEPKTNDNVLINKKKKNPFITVN